MTDESTIKLNITFSYPSFEHEESEEKVENLLSQKAKSSETENYQPSLDSHSLERSLTGRLKAEVDQTNIRRFWDFLSDRLIDKVVEMEVEANGKKLQMKTHNQAELMVAVETARKFVRDLGESW